MNSLEASLEQKRAICIAAVRRPFEPSLIARNTAAQPRKKELWRATVTTGRRVGAFVSPAGKTVYVLFEETYEKNCTPHTPYWSCAGIGEINDVICLIFAYGSSCESGMLQNRRGHMTPEGYIRSWFEELEAPREMRDFEIALKIGTGFYATISSDKMDKISEVLTAIGRVDILTSLLAGETFTLSFQKDAAVILALYGFNREEKLLLCPWLIVKSYHLPSTRWIAMRVSGTLEKPKRLIWRLLPIRLCIALATRIALSCDRMAHCNLPDGPIAWSESSSRTCGKKKCAFPAVSAGASKCFAKR